MQNRLIFDKIERWSWMCDEVSFHPPSVPFSMIVVVILFAVNLATGNRYPKDGRMSPSDLNRDPPPPDDDEEEYPMGMEKQYGIKDPKYTSPVFGQGGPIPGASLPTRPGRMAPNGQYGQYYRGPRPMGPNGPVDPMGPRPMGPNGPVDPMNPLMGRGPLERPGNKDGRSPFDYDVVSEVAKKYKNNPYTGGTSNGGVNDLYDFEEKLTQTGKWDEFLEEMERRKETGDVPKDWQQDVQNWGAWIRNAVNEKKDADNKKMAHANLVRQQPNPEDSSPGHSPYWSQKEEPKKIERTGPDMSQAMMTGQQLLDRAISRMKSYADTGGGAVIPPQLPVDGSFLGEPPIPEQQVPGEENFNGPMPPEMRPPQMRPQPEYEDYGRGMPQMSPGTLEIGPGMRRPPPNTKWPAKGNLHGYRPDNVPPPPQNGYGDPYQRNSQGYRPDNVPPPPQDGYGDPYQRNSQGYRPDNVPPPPQDGYGDPYQRNSQGYRPDNVPPPPQDGYGDPYQRHSQGYRPDDVPPPPPDGYGDPYQAAGLPRPGSVPRFGGMPPRAPNSAPQGIPPQMPIEGPGNMPTGAEWLKTPSIMPNLNPNGMLEMIQSISSGIMPQPPPDQNYRSTNFKVPYTGKPEQQPNLDLPSKDVPNIPQSEQQPNLNLPSNVESDNSKHPKSPSYWSKAIQFHKPKNAITASREQSTAEIKKPKEILLSELPKLDDFRAPVRWVKFNSHDTEDGLARVTDPNTGKNRQARINGSLYVPVVDHNIARLGTISTPPPSTESPRMPAKEEAVYKTLMANVDMEKLDERDWLAIESAMGGRFNDNTCDGDTCQSRCHSLGCQSKCTGDTCASGCVADECTAYCKGPGCLAMCIGENCNARCDGQACDSRCRGKGCEAKCHSFSCHHTINGDFKIGGGTWEQNYPQYDTKYLPPQAEYDA